MPDYKITTDIFSLPYKNNQFVIYAPIQGFACIANKALINLISDIENIKQNDIPSEHRQIIQFLIKKEIINGSPNQFPKSNNSNHLKPSKITLFPTNNCNLKCRYCYAAKQNSPTNTMELKTAKSAIDYFINMMKNEKWTVFPLELHGGGEPFFAWNLIKEIYDYAHAKCRDEDFKLQVHAATNGVLNKNQLHWIIEKLSGLLISFDGLPSVQDFQRRMKDDTGSFYYVNKTLHFLDKHNFPYGIRCTVSTCNEDLLMDTVDFISSNYNTKLLLFEPINICGCNEKNNLSINLNKFIENFKKLYPICIDRDIRLVYSGAQFEKITSTFCYVGTDNFAITPDGYLTNCWEVTSKDHPLAHTFLFGRMLENGKISIDYEKYDYLTSLSVNNLDYCKDCFAKWHCAGDCVLRIGHNQFSGPRGNDRCETNREILSYQIIKMSERKNYYQQIDQ